MVDADEPGIDLLRLQLDELRPRYEARIEKDSEGATDVVLSPKLPDSPISEARLSIDASSNLLRSISYRDLEGNVSRFEISGYRPLQVTAHFSPPEAIEWLDQ